MGADSKIQWTHHTFNPVLGCSKVHTGCTNCYAENEQAIVMRKGGRIHWGEVWQGGDRVVVADSTWKHPFTWARKAAAAGERHRVFCASLADVLEAPADPPAGRPWSEWHRAADARATLDAARARLWDTIRRTATIMHMGERSFSGGGLDWLLLTKRPENWKLVPEDVRPLVWLGTSVSDSETMLEWGSRLMQARGFRHRFLSVEPLLGPIDLGLFGTAPKDWGYGYRPIYDLIDWVIVGGESGSKARPCNLDWVRSVVVQCAEAGVPCFVKQLGAEPVRQVGSEPDVPLQLTDPKGGDWDEWPEDLRVRQFPK